MIINVLTENTAVSNEFESEHGLCLYIQTAKHKMLFDVGKTDMFLRNARKLNVDISEVDTLVISHGHYDHAGGLSAFLNANKKAKIYIHIKAFDEHYSLISDGSFVYNGLDKELANNERIIFTSDYCKIDDELELIADIKDYELISGCNNNLYINQNSTFSIDTFEHEQNLLISEKNNVVLIAGCAHRGIVNILNRANEIKFNNVNYAIGGFHLSNPRTGESEPEHLLSEIGGKLKTANTSFFTCHCTGIKAYEYLKNILNDKLNYLSVGNTVEI